MRLFRFDAAVGRPIERFGSTQLMLSPIQRTTSQVQISCMHVGPSGVVGFHPAESAQLFLVVAGEGWVRSENLESAPIQTGQAAFWERGEWHASGSHTGMTVIVIESETLEPDQFMPEKLPE
jgi:quercetin dioxygenase-like cupin family protein